MKKSHVILAVVPAVCALAGYGLGEVLGPSADAAPTHQATPEPSQAEHVLNTLAEAEAHATTDIAHKAPRPTGADSSILPAALPAVPQKVAHDAAPAEPRREASPYRRSGYEPHKAGTHDMLAKGHADDVETIETLSGSPSLLPVQDETRIALGAIKKLENSDQHVVKLGRMTVPVYKAEAVTYVVADFGVAVTDMDEASRYYAAENAARLRDRIMETLHRAANTHALSGPRIDSDALAQQVARDLKSNFKGVEDFIFLSLYKTDVPRG